MLLVSSVNFFSKLSFSKKKKIKEHYQSVKLFGWRSRLTVRPDLDPNCLQRLSADDKIFDVVC